MIQMEIETTLDTIQDVALYQKKRGHRFTIDSVLLADFVRKQRPSRIIDLGAGNGIIGILLARKYPRARVVLVEVQQELFLLCERNRQINQVGDRVSAIHGDIAHIEQIPELAARSFDVVVTNPPFRRSHTGRISPHDERAIARHEIKMDLRLLLRAVQYLLKPKGYLYVICHPERIVEVFGLMSMHEIEPKKARFIHPDSLSEATMAMIEGVRAARPAMKIEPPLFIYTNNGQYTEEVSRILNG